MDSPLCAYVTVSLSLLQDCGCHKLETCQVLRYEQLFQAPLEHGTATSHVEFAKFPCMGCEVVFASPLAQKHPMELFTLEHRKRHETNTYVFFVNSMNN